MFSPALSGLFFCSGGQSSSCPAPTGHLPSGTSCFGRFLGRKLSLAPPARAPIRANSFRLEARHSAGAPVLVAFGTVLPAAYAKGRGGRGAPFAGAHFVPSHRFLRPRFAGTCLRRAPSLFLWPRGATPPATFPFFCLLAPVTPETSGESQRWQRACRGGGPLGPEPTGPGSLGAAAPRCRTAAVPVLEAFRLEGHVQECISVAFFVHAAKLLLGAMNKIALPDLFLYMTLQINE